MPHIFDHAASDVERADLAAWATELRRRELLRPDPLGPGRFHRNIAELPRLHPSLIDVRGRLVERFGLGRYRTDPALGDMVSFHEQGAFDHPHTDPYIEGERHVRINIIVQHPASGGVPVLDGQELPITPGQGWFFRPYKVLHSSTVVTGDIPRIDISLGWSVPPSFRIPGEPARDNVSLVEELFDAIRRWDEAALRQLLAPDVRVRFPGNSPFAGEHAGQDAVIALWARQRRFLGKQTLELQPIDTLNGNDHVVVLTRSRAATGAWETANVYRLRAGCVVEASPIVTGLEPFDRFWSTLDQ